MKDNERHYFPGNNTPGGFFSYYDNILNPKAAKKIWYLKGGPGTGKSTLIKQIGENFLSEGKDVDFLHCSADKDSLDGVVLRNEGVAVVDGTAPHVLDPVYPGAVDRIVNLGQYWNEEGISGNRQRIIQIIQEKKADFARAYNYLAAAEKMYDNLQYIPGRLTSIRAARRMAEEIIRDGASNIRDTEGEGGVRRLFACAVTPQGLVDFTHRIIGKCKKVYLIKTDPGSGCEMVLSRILENITDRGFDAEAFYCSMKPHRKIDHLLVPGLSFAVITSNKFHNFVPEEGSKEVISIEFQRIQSEATDGCAAAMEELIAGAVRCLGEAKSKHDELEDIYTPNMDFEKIEELRKQIENEIREEGKVPMALAVK
ncbi:PRK06851 family protein [Bacillota bacterium]